MGYEILKMGPTELNVHRTPSTVKSGEVLTDRGGNFFVYDGSTGKLVRVTASTTNVTGWVEPNKAKTLTADEVLNRLKPDVPCRIPINNGTYVKTMEGECFDLSISSGIQGIDLEVQTKKHVQIVSGDLENNEYVIVIVNPDALYTP